MDNKNLLWIGGGLVVLVLAFFTYTHFADREYNWYSKYEIKGDQPFHTSILYSLLEEEASVSLIENTVLRELPVNGTSEVYLLIDNWLNISDKEGERLKDFVAQGNTAFLSLENPQSLLEILLEEEEFTDIGGLFQRNGIGDTLSWKGENGKVLHFYCERPLDTSEAPFIFLELRSFDEVYQQQLSHYYWRYYEEDGVDSTNTSSFDSTWLSAEDRKEVFTKTYTYFEYIETFRQPVFKAGSEKPTGIGMIEVPHGKGKFYIHLYPALFTNYFLKEEDGYAHMQQVFGLLKGQEIYWDTESGNPYRQFNKNNLTTADETVFQFIMKYKSLKAAWYLILLLTVLYLIFFSKRRQRAIPYILSPKNTSIAFAEAIGSLIKKNNDHKQLVELKMKLFVGRLRSEYNIKTHEVSVAMVQEVKDKTSASDDVVDKVFTTYHQLHKRTTGVDATDFLRLVAYMEAFYKETNKQKIWI
ncbi:DUF4350 domain-containing protein [Algivirga pacifica]|uniref:DUF4350 domain-containing protein n=1 Tax=Algivirga pacifica TaxID=1162670 RepID=A0ABP9DHW2_9BACT